MKKFILPIVAAFILSSCNALQNEQQYSEDYEEGEIENQKDVTSSINKFNDDIFLQVCNDIKSVFYSSPSLYNLLFALKEGAEGETLAELDKVLYVSDGDYSASLRKLDSSIENMTNSIWIQKNLSLREEYRKKVERYGFSLFQKDFNREPAKTRNDINNFIEKNTKKLIKNFLQDNLPENTKLILLNTLYFEQEWQNQFEKENTHESKFYITAKDVKNLNFMHQTKYFKYAEYDGFKAVRLPYKSDYSMYVFLPDETERNFSDIKLSELLERFNDEASSFAEKNRYQSVVLSFPKFENETDYDFVEILNTLGVKTIFNPLESNLSKILKGQENLYVNFIKHKAKINVSEEKTVAAAVSMIGIKAMSTGPSKNVYFNADHPFIYAIMDDQTGLVLFTGIFRG